MKKIPTLFVREYDERGNIKQVTRQVTAGMEWVLAGRGEATEKVDGAACAIINGEFYQRFDAKEGRRVPGGAIPCQPTRDPYTGHWPHWVKVTNPAGSGKWFMRAWANTTWATEDGTYEAVGPHFQSNPYGLDDEFLERHGRIKIKDCPRDYDGIREWLRAHEVEGIVFWKDGEPRCKIKRSDFGFPWPVKGGAVMTVIRCDHCGREIDDMKDVAIVEVGNWYNGHTRNRFELCPLCREKLLEMWFKEQNSLRKREEKLEHISQDVMEQIKGGKEWIG